MKNLAYLKGIILLSFSLLVLSYCNHSHDFLNGDWKWINNSYDKYPSTNVFYQGMVIHKDSLLFVGDYMLNPFFNVKKYSASNDSIFIQYDDGVRGFKYTVQNDSLTLAKGESIYIFERTEQLSKNLIDSLSFSSENLGRGAEQSYFFELCLNNEGFYTYQSKYQTWQKKGQLQERYRNFIFDKLNKIDLPIKYNAQEVIITHEHIFTMELFKNGVKLDSLTYSKEVEGAYAKWLASILQSAPLWIDDATIKEK